MVQIERALRPFWMHQIVEYLVGIVLISAAFQSLEPAVPAVLGVVILLNAAIAIGPASAFRVVHRKVHRLMDLVVIAVLIVAAVQPWIDMEGTGRLLVGMIALVMFTVWFHTDFAERAERKQRRAARAGQGSEDFGRRAGRMVGEGYKAAKRMRDRP